MKTEINLNSEIGSIFLAAIGHGKPTKEKRDDLARICQRRSEPDVYDIEMKINGVEVDFVGVIEKYFDLADRFFAEKAVFVLKDKLYDAIGKLEEFTDMVDELKNMFADLYDD